VEGLLVQIIIGLAVALLCSGLLNRRLRRRARTAEARCAHHAQERDRQTGSREGEHRARLAEFDDDKLWRVVQAYGDKRAEELLVARFRRQLTPGDDHE